MESWRRMFDATLAVTENYGAAIDAADMHSGVRPTHLSISHTTVLRIHRRTKTWDLTGRKHGQFYRMMRGTFGGIDWGEK